MNTKRQTVWLVSMLSLMVVLSAYYLFTDTPGTNTDLTATESLNEQKMEDTATEAAGEAITAEDVTDAPKGAEAVETTDAAGTSDPADKSEAADPAAESKDSASSGETASKDADKETAAEDMLGTEDLTDEAVLKMVEAQGQNSADFFAQKAMERDDNFAKQYEKLLAMTVDMKNTPEQATQAQNDIDLMQQREAKLTTLEEELMKEYQNAVVLNDEDQWTVIVQSEKLQPSEAVSILDRTITELKVDPDKVSVQYKK
ncbi:SpoIIIAH-like family protein [Paenibacillus gansuensis]|uniref:SpoIIIAH-like family protein n=1 Tax=Paenibacillus gansuensis TaxID=306542 RepID=A0ABW5P9B1_9BACL